MRLALCHNPAVRRLLAIASLAFGWLCANGALWDVMQLAAWGKMFAGYSATLPLGEALRQTLDPTKPCEMCVGIAKAKDDAAKHTPAPENASAGAKFLLALEGCDAPVFRRDAEVWAVLASAAPLDRGDPVRLRPPRV